MIDFFSKDARRFRITLSVCLTLILLVATAAIVFSVKYLENYAATVKKSSYAASTSQTHIDTISKLAQNIKEQSDSVARVEQIVADSKKYVYQDVIINDLRSMANKAGVTITNFDFTTADASGKKAAASSGLRSTTVGVTLVNPVEYKKFLNFIHYIELNNTKMQISNISLSTPSDTQKINYVNSDVLQIEVYVR